MFDFLVIKVVADLFPAKQRALAMSVFAIAPFLGPVIGPIAGGFLPTWEWLFWTVRAESFVEFFPRLTRLTLSGGLRRLFSERLSTLWNCLFPKPVRLPIRTSLPTSN